MTNRTFTQGGNAPLNLFQFEAINNDMALYMVTTNPTGPVVQVNRAGKPRLATRAALLAHPALAGIGKERVPFAELKTDGVGFADCANQRNEREQHGQDSRGVGGREGFRGWVQGNARSTRSALAPKR